MSDLQYIRFSYCNSCPSAYILSISWLVKKRRVSGPNLKGFRSPSVLRKCFALYKGWSRLYELKDILCLVVYSWLQLWASNLGFRSTRQKVIVLSLVKKGLTSFWTNKCYLTGVLSDDVIHQLFPLLPGSRKLCANCLKCCNCPLYNFRRIWSTRSRVFVESTRVILRHPFVCALIKRYGKLQCGGTTFLPILHSTTSFLRFIQKFRFFLHSCHGPFSEICIIYPSSVISVLLRTSNRHSLVSNDWCLVLWYYRAQRHFIYVWSLSFLSVRDVSCYLPRLRISGRSLLSRQHSV